MNDPFPAPAMGPKAGKEIRGNRRGHGLLSVGIMIALVEQKKNDLAGLCRRFNVERLELFGSAATGSFQSPSSDLDFIVRFSALSTGSYLDRYLDFAEALEQLFQRPVDLLTENHLDS